MKAKPRIFRPREILPGFELSLRLIRHPGAQSFEKLKRDSPETPLKILKEIQEGDELLAGKVTIRGTLVDVKHQQMITMESPITDGEFSQLKAAVRAVRKFALEAAKKRRAESGKHT